MKAYSLDLRTKIVQAYQNGEGSQRHIARRFDVSLSFVRDLLKRYRQTGALNPRKPGGSTSKIDQESLQLIRNLIDYNDHLTVSRVREVLAEKRHVVVSRSTVWRVLRRSPNYSTNHNQYGS